MSGRILKQTEEDIKSCHLLVDSGKEPRHIGMNIVSSAMDGNFKYPVRRFEATNVCELSHPCDWIRYAVFGSGIYIGMKMFS